MTYRAKDDATLLAALAAYVAAEENVADLGSVPVFGVDAEEQALIDNHVWHVRRDLTNAKRRLFGIIDRRVKKAVATPGCVG